MTWLRRWFAAWLDLDALPGLLESVGDMGDHGPDF